MISDIGAVLSRISWSEEQLQLSELLKNRQLPQLVRVVRGQYLNVGPGGLSSPGHIHTLLLIAGGSGRRLVAQGIKFKDSRRFVTVGQKLLVPSSFEGLFEILSEGGRCVRGIESVMELARRFPDSCIVRENCKAYVSKSDNVETITDRTRTIQSGETLVLVGEVVRTKGARAGPHARFLRCFDSAGENVYLQYDLKVKFSAVAKEDNISGVHSTSNLLNKRLPLNVRLVNSRSPDGSKNNCASSISDLRIHTTYDKELVVGIPVSKDGMLVALPASAPIKVQCAVNVGELNSSEEFARLCQRSSQIWAEASDRVHPFEVALPRPDLLDARGKPMAPAPTLRPSAFKMGSGHMPRATRQRYGDIVDEYDEVDQIYDYVRGFAPLPKNLRIPNHRTSPERRVGMTSPPIGDSQKPEPPPIETIPTRRVPQSDRPVSIHPGIYVANIQRSDKKPSGKRAHQSSSMERKQAAKNEANQPTKLFAKNSAPKNKPRLFRQKTTSALKNSGVYYVSHSSAQGSGGPSALFSMRYKSLTNLALDPNNTLNSSTSGEKTSGDSGDSAAIKAKLPEKKLKKLLGRPRSMTNLVWSPPPQPVIMERYVKPDLIMDQDRRARLDPGVYRKRNSVIALNDRLAGQKKLGTLYL